MLVREAAHLLGVDEAHAVGDLLEAGDLEALARLDGLDELAAWISDSCVPVSSQAKPRPQQLDVELAALAGRRG